MKILGGLVALIFVLALIGFFAFNESLPETQKGPEADQLADQMLAAMNKPAWDTTYWVQWTFRGVNHYTWDRQRKLVEVKWDDNRVLVNTDDRRKSKAFSGGNPVTGEAANPLIETAWSYFCNDSYWLIAPFKVYDPGVERSVLTLDDGRKGLMVTYTSGGVTPGDSYLWILGEDGLPTSYKMWVQIIPIGGVEATWANWTTQPTGVKIASEHKLGSLEIPVTNIKAVHTMAELRMGADPFVGM